MRSTTTATIKSRINTGEAAISSSPNPSKLSLSRGCLAHRWIRWRSLRSGTAWQCDPWWFHMCLGLEPGPYRYKWTRSPLGYTEHLNGKVSSELTNWIKSQNCSENWNIWNSAKLLLLNHTWKTWKHRSRTKLQTLPAKVAWQPKRKIIRRVLLRNPSAALEKRRFWVVVLIEDCAGGRHRFSSEQFIPAKSWHGINQIKNQQQQLQGTAAFLTLLIALNCSGHIEQVHFKQL